MVVRWTERAVGHTPPRWEDDEVGNGHAGSRGLGSQHRKDGWVLREGRRSNESLLVSDIITRALTAWSKATQLMTMKSSRLYLYGV